MTPKRRAVILPVVLLILVLLGLLVAMFSFRVNADLASTQAVAMRLQTRLAAEAGLDRMLMLLREFRFDMDRWYHNPDELHRVIVWVHEGDQTLFGTNDEFEDEGLMAYRFSIVADDPTDDEDRIRLGVTDEASKINLNTATEAQLMVLVRHAVGGDPEINPKALVDAILDWRDADRVVRGGARDTEGEYYRKLPKPYIIKNGPFDTLEELLLVKGITGRILYGEDFDRNGLLTPNEDDGDDSFPPDNEDGVLNPGLYPYLTVVSSENNVSNDNRPRVYLFGDEEKLKVELNLAFPDDPRVVEFIVRATRPVTNRGSTGRGGSGNTGNAGTSGSRGGGSTDTRDGGETGENTDSPGGGGSADSSGTRAGGGRETDGANTDVGPIRTPASLLRDRPLDGFLLPSPVGVSHLATLMDRTTTVERDQRTIPGLVNINTAPRLVLRALGVLTEEEIDGILDERDRLGPESKATTAWLLEEEIIELDTFERLAPLITARAQQFTIEALGYGDHIGMVTRLQVVVDFVGPIAQTLYFRDLTYLGAHYPIREDDLEKIRAR